MATASALVRTYEALRPKILQRLLELRPTLDPSLARLDEEAARAQVDAVLAHLGSFLATGELGLHRTFLQTFLAMRAAEAQSPASVLATLVAIGDTATRVAQEEGAGTAEGRALTLQLTRITASTARALNDLIAEQLESRRRSWRDLSKHRSGTPS